MRIAYVCADSGVPVFGQKGCSIHVQEVIRALRNQGTTVELLAAKIGGEAPIDLQDLKIYSLSQVPKGMPIAQREAELLTMNDEIQKILEASAPYDLIYERYSLWSYAGMAFARSQGIPGFLEVNAPLIEEQAKHRGLVNRRKAAEVAMRTFRYATQLIAVSQGVKQYLMDWVNSDHIQVIPNGVDVNRFTLLPESCPDQSEFTVGFVGTIKPWHGLEHLVDAFTKLHRRVPNARLLIVGDGPEQHTLEQTIIERGLEAFVQWTGAVPPAQIPEWLSQMNVAVAPYPLLEEFYFSPLKVMEYMAAGLPVVVSQIGQLEEIISDGVTGLFCPPGDSHELAKTLEDLWRSPSLCRRLGSSARQKVCAQYTWDSVVQKILSLKTPIKSAECPESMISQIPSKILINS